MTSGSDRGEWGLFDRPLFEDPAAQALARVGVIDVGSNSVRMVIFDGAARSPAYFFNEKVMCGLGRGIAETGMLHPEGRERALAALKRFHILAESMNLGSMSAVATAAVREAADGPAFRDEVRESTGIELHVIDGTQEAQFSAQGVLLGWPGAEGLVSDIGGASMELATVSAGQVGARVTSPLGPFKLADVKGGRKGLKAHVAAEIEAMAAQVGTGHERLYLVGGSWRAIARLDMFRRGYPLKVLHEYRMAPKALISTLKWIRETDLDPIRAEAGISAERAALVPTAAVVLQALLRRFRPAEVAVSAYGLREGLLYEQMPAPVRARDPLIEACRFAEAKDARMPGFGKELYGFLKPIYRNERPERLRIVKAACLLHDVAWRAHPDYRHEVTFDNVTRANLGGLSHQERVFLGLSLLHRYKGSRAGSPFAPLFALLPEAEIARAEVLGRAMRFGAMFAVDRLGETAALRWRPKKRELHLMLTPTGHDLLGEVALARFEALAQALGATALVSDWRPRP